MALSVWNSLYNASFVVLVFIQLGLVCVTPIDTILQSQKSGQFWDVIIIVVACVISVVVSILFYLQRIIQVRRSISMIPKRYMFHADEIPNHCVKKIEDEYKRCRNIVAKTRPNAIAVSHPGMMNPELLREDSQTVVSARYDEILSLSLEYFQLKARQLHSTFTKPPSMTIRSYLQLLSSYKVLDASPDVLARFIDIYERTRFSGNPISEADYTDFMDLLTCILTAVKQPGSGSSQLGKSPSTVSISGNNSLSPSKSRVEDFPSGSSSVGQFNDFLSVPHMSRSGSLVTTASLRDNIIESMREFRTKQSDPARLRPPGSYNYAGSTKQLVSRTHSRDSSLYPTFSHTGPVTSPELSRWNSAMYAVHSLTPLHTKIASDEVDYDSQSLHTASTNSDGSVIIRRKEKKK